MPATHRIARCPQCGKSCRSDAANSWRPFCSERCKLMDLGDWLDERYRVPAENQEIPAEDSGEES